MALLCARAIKNLSFWKKWTRQYSLMSPTSKLIEVGCLEEPKIYESYSPGQFFLHRVFGYRGIILFHWVSRVYDRNNGGQTNKTNYSQWEEEGQTMDKLGELKGEKETYYQVLVDQRDFSQMRTSPEAITLTDRKEHTLFSIRGLDYVSHEDVLPYFPSDQEPLQHELFRKFFMPTDDNTVAPFTGKDLLSTWHHKNINWLEQIEVHRETNRNIRVIVMPFYIGSRDTQHELTSVYWWRYCIRIENLSGSRVQLRQRHWRVYSDNGSLETVRGDGVVGQQPILSVRQPAFQYSSHVSLQAPSGHMWGTFHMEREDGKVFDIRIPPFQLKSHELL